VFDIQLPALMAGCPGEIDRPGKSTTAQTGVSVERLE